MFGRKCIQQESALTLFDVCNLVEQDGIVVRREGDSFVPAPFHPHGPAFQLKSRIIQCRVWTPPYIEKVNPVPLMERCLLCRTVEDLISTGVPSKGYVCLCVPVSLSVSTHTRVSNVCASKREKKKEKKRQPSVQTCLLIPH